MSLHSTRQPARGNILQISLIVLLAVFACCTWAGNTLSSIADESLSYSPDLHIAFALPAEPGAAKRTAERLPQDDNSWKPFCASTHTSQSVINIARQALPTVLYQHASLTEQVHSPQAARAPPQA